MPDPVETMEVELASGVKVNLPKEQALKEIEHRQKVKNELRQSNEELGKIKAEKDAELAKAEKARTDAEAQAAIKAGELEKAREIYQKQSDEKISKIEKGYRSSRLEAMILANTSVIPEAAGDIARALLHGCRYEFDSEKLTPVDEAGKPRLDKDGKPLGADALLAEYLDKRPYLKRSTAPEGSGASGSSESGTNPVMKREQWEKLPQKERALFFEKKGKLLD